MQYKSSKDILVWPSNYCCYRHEYAKYGNKDDFVVVPFGSLFYPGENADFSRSGSGITIHEVDYDTVVNSRRAMLNFKE